MSKYIGTEILTKAVNFVIYDCYNDFERTLEIIEDIEENAGIEIIHCHECKHWEEQKDSIKGWCDKLEHYVYPDFFCADGEPKEVTD